MKKAALIIFFLALSAAWCSAAVQTGVAVIFSADLEPYRTAWEGFKKHLNENGASPLSTEFVLERDMPTLILRHLARKKPHLVVAIGPNAAKFAQKNIQDIPIVYFMVLRADGLSGQNLTGVTLEIPFSLKLERIKKLLPAARKIGVIYSPRSLRSYRELLACCDKAGFLLVGSELESTKEFPDALKDLFRRVDAFLMLPDTKIYFPKSIEHLLVESLRSRVPVIGLSSSYTRAGALASLDVDYDDLGRQAGELALRVLDGEVPGRIRPVGPRTIRFSLNLAVAHRLGLTLPLSAAGEAAEVFGR